MTSYEWDCSYLHHCSNLYQSSSSSSRSFCLVVQSHIILTHCLKTKRKIMSADNSNTATTSRPSTDPEAARTAAQTDHRHHSIPIPDKVTGAGQNQGAQKKATEPIEADTSAYPENKSNNQGAASPEQVANRSTN
ncbi:unnamed protein product [Rotaria sordida]|uniref:Uncharacterized protein n=1 Tax=Rotaria sordida TaxID=392033 RepID=A0A814IMC6_9BILA|nr:unnamed protein product [Rotaria sordida]CAF4063165.1 unnamed protein product [Rotaria sordida]